MSTPYRYYAELVTDPDAAYDRLINELDWVHKDPLIPRKEYYVHDQGLPYVYGSGKFARQYDEQVIAKKIAELDLTKEEGVVLRVADAFQYGEYKHSVCKWVRPGHVQTNKHWAYGQRVVPNRLADDSDRSATAS